MINILCFGGAAGAMLFALFMLTKVIEDGWLAVPNAFNWIIERTMGRRRWKAEMEAEGLAQRIAWLENCSRQWEELRAQGRDPLWTDVFGWVADAEVCPCGYLDECAIWCGNGHETGLCTRHGFGPYPVIRFVDDAGRPVRNAHRVKYLPSDRMEL